MTLTTNAIEEIETLWIAMSDGTRLAARIWRPANAVESPVPAILEYIPYRRRDRTRLRDESMHRAFARAGYACLRVDLRGTGDSEGLMADEYLPQELEDACEIIAWIADQPWCTGKVGMMGKSWGAYNALQVAAMRPPALKAILPVMGTDDRWNECIHFLGGGLMTDNFWWGAIMQLLNAFPPDPDTAARDWREMWKERLDAMTFWPADWLHHQTRDHQWKHGSVCEDYSAIEVPVFYIGGWADHYRTTPFRLAANLDTPCKVLMGPWAHVYPHEGAPLPAVDFVAEALRWWDHWLKGIDTGVMDEPAMRCFMQDSEPPATFRTHRKGDWIEEPSWPSPNVKPRDLWLNPGRLEPSPRQEGADMSICSPQSFGAEGGDMCSFAIAGDLPGDCSLEAGGALVFRGDVQEHPIEILGPTQLTLSVAADRPQGFVAALLADEAPDGRQTLITRGIFNLVHRDGPDRVTPIVAGETMQVDLWMHATGYRVAAGHRVVLQIASTYWPIIWPAPQPVTLTLKPGRSCLHLPVRHVRDEAPTPRPLCSPPETGPRPVTKLHDGVLERTVIRDRETGKLTHRTYIDGGVFGPVGAMRLDDTGTAMSDISNRVYELTGEDPLTARARMDQSASFSRGDNWNVRVETTAEMHATATTFELTASVTCWDGDTEFHHVDWTHSIPRNGM